MDDDIPLAALAGKPTTKAVKKPGPGAGRPAASPAAKGASPGRPAGSPAAKAKAAAKPGAKRRAASSSSSSSSGYSSSYSSSDDDKKPIVRKKRQASAKPGAKKPPKKKAPKTKKEGSDAEVSDQEQHKVKKFDRSKKDMMIAEFLCRWWYVMEDWPPKDDEFYLPRLKEKGLRKVTIQEWEFVPEVDSNGLQKAYELSQYKGLFRSATGDLIDLRPQETCPCYNNAAKWSMLTLCENLKTACERQLKELEVSKYRDADTVGKLTKRITELQHQCAKLRELGGN